MLTQDSFQRENHWAGLKSDWPTCLIKKDDNEVDDDLVVILRNDEGDKETKTEVLFIDVTFDVRTNNTDHKSHFLERCKGYSMGMNYNQRVHERSIIREIQDLREVLSKRVQMQQNNMRTMVKMMTGCFDGTDNEDPDMDNKWDIYRQSSRSNGHSFCEEL